MQAVLRPITKSPKLKFYLEELHHFLDEEALRRQAFYDAVEDGVKTEFINGEIVVHSPDKARHIRVRERLSRLITSYVDLHNLGWAGGEKALTVFTRNDYMPDVVFFSKAKAAKIKPETMKFPVPDFIVEILSPSTQRRDRGVKLVDYAAHGVGEYWIVDPVAEALEVWLPDGEGGYGMKLRTQVGTVEALVIRGLRVPVRALFDDQANLTALGELLGGLSRDA